MPIFEQIVTNQSSWVNRWSYDSTNHLFVFYTRGDPLNPYRFSMTDGEFVRFLQEVLVTGSWGKAVNLRVKTLPPYDSAEALADLILELDSELSPSVRAEMLRGVRDHLKRYT